MTTLSPPFDINIEEVEKQETDGLKYSHLIVKMTGKTVEPVVINTLRRVMLNNIPIYAFPSECIVIENNTSVFNNDQMRIRLCQLPILNTKSELDYLEDKYWLDVNYANKEREKHPQEKSIELYISATNVDENIKNVTTNDVQYYEDNILVNNKYDKKYPIVLIKLRPKETFKCKLKAVLGTGERNVIWAGAGNVYYSYSEHEALMTIESHGQIDEYELMWKACRYMQNKFENLKHVIQEKYESSKTEINPKTIELVLDNESHTIGGILMSVIQDNKKVAYAGVGKRNELVKQITLLIKYNEATSEPLKPIMDSIDYVIELMKYMEGKVYNVGKKYINNGVKKSEKTQKKVEEKPSVVKSEPKKEKKPKKK